MDVLIVAEKRMLAGNANERIGSVQPTCKWLGHGKLQPSAFCARDPELHARSGAVTGDAENGVKIHTHRRDPNVQVASIQGSGNRVRLIGCLWTLAVLLPKKTPVTSRTL